MAEPGGAGFDPRIPNAAHTYDYALGGAHNFAADRELSDRIQAAWPDFRDGLVLAAILLWLRRPRETRPR